MNIHVSSELNKRLKDKMKKAGAAKDDDDKKDIRKDSRSLDTALDIDEMSGSTSSSSFCDKKRDGVSAVEPKDRFDRVAISEISIAQPIILTIHGITVDVCSWARAHPGGEAILRRFHNRDATYAFDAVGHSESARTTLQNFALESRKFVLSPVENDQASLLLVGATKMNWRRKLFTKEDPVGLHKYCGIYVLLHFVCRYTQAIMGDPSTGFGTRRGLGPDPISLLFVLPHALLSMSSLIFHTVPRERVVGKPMIWVGIYGTQCFPPSHLKITLQEFLSFSLYFSFLVLSSNHSYTYVSERISSPFNYLWPSLSLLHCTFFPLNM